MAEVRERAVAHIEAKEAVVVKPSNTQPKLGKYRESGRDHHPKNIDSSVNRRFDQRYIPYVAKKGDTKEGMEGELLKMRFRISYKSLITKESVAKRLRFPKKTDRVLGGQRDNWCELHRARGHDIEQASPWPTNYQSL